MTECIINGSKVFPDTSQTIKVTYANPYVEDSGSYTYELSFPMSILENRILFRNVDRFDTSKKLPDYDDCRLLVDNRLVVSGKGTVTGINNDMVKLQIIGGKSRIKYDSMFAKHYIDEVDYPDTGINPSTVDIENWPFNVKLEGIIPIDLSQSHIVGEEGKFAFNPVYDETNDIIANNVLVTDFLTGGQKAYMYDVAVQPYLLYVLEKVLDSEGFMIGRNDFDCSPWDRIVICSARKGVKIKNALPHWTVYTFIEEVAKLLNATFHFDDATRTVDIISTNELISHGVKKYECLDEFNVESEDDGLKSLITSNVKYDFPESSNRSYRDVMPAGILKKFPLVEKPSVAALIIDTGTMPEKEARTILFKVKSLYYFVKEVDPDAGYLFVPCGFFNPLVRDGDSEDFVELKICSAAMNDMSRWREDDNRWLKLIDRQANDLVIHVPSVANDWEDSLNAMTIEEDGGDYYVSVDDAMQDETLLDEESEDEDQRMLVMFQGDSVFNYRKNCPEHPETDGPGDSPAYRYPVAFTDYRKETWVSSLGEQLSLALDQLPGHSDLPDIRIDIHNLFTIKFVTDDIPDPSTIFVFRNRKFICRKIEMEVRDGCIDQVKTGYFYEVV